MKTFKTYLVAIALAAFTASCSKDDDNVVFIPVSTPPTHLIKSETTIYPFEPDLHTVLYEYDAENRITFALRDAVSSTFTRNGDGRITQEAFHYDLNTYHMNYSYNASGQLIQQERLNASGLVIYRHAYSYFPDRYEDRFYNSGNENTQTLINYYSPDHKNIDLMIFKHIGFPDRTYTYTYDDKIGFEQIAPYSQFPQPFYNANNLVEQVITDSNGGPAQHKIHHLTYTSDGYPQTTDFGNPGCKNTLEYIVK